jgi:TatA/E family protein of Tat protein translocase
MFGIGPQELIVILVVGLLVLGPKRLPEIARSLGKGLAEFRRASSDLRQSLALEDEPRRYAPPPRPPAQAVQGELPKASEETNQIAPPDGAAATSAPTPGENGDSPEAAEPADASERIEK